MISTADTVSPPVGLDGVTASWMTSALGLEHPGVVVTTLTVGPVRHGTNTTARLLLDYNAAGHAARLPPTMYVKGAWTGRGVGDTLSEARFYQHVAPRLAEMNIPACYFASVDPVSAQAVVVMEDLLARNVVLTGVDRSLSVAQAVDLADQLARLHAVWFASPVLDTLEWARPRGTVLRFDPAEAENETGIFGTFKDWWWDKRMANGHADHLPDWLRDRLLIKQALINLYRLEQGGPRCLVHGDPHLGNLFLDVDGRPGIYDWGGRIGRWGHDVNYAVIGSLDIADRRAHERDILGHYLDRLAAYGGPELAPGEAWLSWRRQTLHGYLWVMCSPRQQPEELIALQTARFGAAAEDHDLRSALEVG